MRRTIAHLTGERHDTAYAVHVFVRFLGIEYPILLAGMGVWGMATPPELVAAVSEAGGAGVLGCSRLAPQEIRARVQRLRQLTDKPFGVDLPLPASLAPAATTRAGVRRELEENHPQHVAFLKKLLSDHDPPETPVQPRSSTLLVRASIAARQRAADSTATKSLPAALKVTGPQPSLRLR